ncbi:hypothetical protein GCM10009868_01250 [Terrabacter aerolatus]|uniref:Uncharacterized protein n=1 Tax=Terrabacter aerolatus TaxID=422442 RepID=A0A512D5R4_9MICO|nr:hypothetical protein TAE01_36240 [Terrabacter aerolatus]
MQRTVVEQTEHRELEQRGAAALGAVGRGHGFTVHPDISLRYIWVSVAGDDRRTVTHPARGVTHAAGRVDGEGESVVPSNPPGSG